MIEKPAKVVFLCVFVVALAARLTYIALVPPRLTPDSFDYLLLATNIRAHASFSLSTTAPYTPAIRRPPGYPLFLTLFGGSLNGVRAVQSLLDALIAALISVLAARGVRLRWATAAGLLYALHPGAILYASSILSETLFTVLLSGAIALLVLSIDRNQLRWAAAGGATMAMATLCRPIGTPFIIIAASVVMMMTSVPRRFRIAGLFCAAAALTLAPWVMRSSILAGRFVLVSAGGALNLALATANGPWDLNDQASIYKGDYYAHTDPCGHAVSYARDPRASAKADDICFEEALRNLRRYPGYYARSRVSQLIHFPLTSFDFVTGNRVSLGAALRQKQFGVLASKLFLYSVFALTPLLLGFVGALFGAPVIERRLAAAVWIFTLLIYAPGFVEYRYFLPAVPMLLVCAAFGLQRLEESARRSAS